MPSGAAAAVPNTLTAMPAATAKSRNAVGSTMAVRCRGWCADGQCPSQGGDTGQVSKQGQQDMDIADGKVQLAGDFLEQDQQACGSCHPDSWLPAATERITHAQRRASQRKSHHQCQRG
jgi:hypothetical protein